MSRRLIAGLAAAALAAVALAGCGDDETPDPPAATGQPGGGPGAGDPPPPDAPEVTPKLAADLAAMRSTTAGYVTDLDAALADGFFVITQHMPGQGYHFLNPDVDGSDPTRPPILMYTRDGDGWQLAGFEWVYPEEPAEPPLDGATYGSFPAACHYDDGLFVEATAEDACAGTHPDSAAAFTFWHPDLVTLHVWAWMPNPMGLYHPTNPLIADAGGTGAGAGHGHR
jgi:hypothetical protein